MGGIKLSTLGAIPYAASTFGAITSCIRLNVLKRDSEHHHTLPCTLLKVKQEAKKKGAQQGSINKMLQHGTSKQQFSRDDVMRTVAEFIVCNNQVSCCSESWVEVTYIVWQSLAVANKPAFRNCLVMMHPNANKADIPSSHDISNFIHNSFVDFFQSLKSRIQVSLFILLKLVV